MSKENDNQKTQAASSGIDEITGHNEREISEAYIPEETVAQISEAKNKLSEGREIITDSEGVVFDKELHATDNDGKPSVTKLGKFRKKKGVSSIAIKEKQKKAEDVVNNEKALQEMGEGAAGTFVAVGAAIFGEDFLPENQDEERRLSEAFAKYLKASGMKDLPPGLALTVALGAYGYRRVHKPQVKSKLQKFKDWSLYQIIKLKGKLKNASYSSSRTEPKRENNANKANSEQTKNEGVRNISS